MPMDTAANPLTVQVPHLQKNPQKAARPSLRKVPPARLTLLRKAKQTVLQLPEIVIPENCFKSVSLITTPSIRL